MKIRLSLLCMVVFLTAMNVTDAQLLDNPHAGAFLPGGGGLGAGGQSSFRQVQGDVQAGIPGRFWFETNVADEGLGYNGSYLTIGGKRRLFEDFLDGRWLFEAQLHHSIDEDEGDFFTNIGIERVFSIPAAGADISIGGWYDYNEETDTGFSNPFHQVGISGAIKSRRWDLLANGYFPIGDTDFSLGDPTGATPFARNFLLSAPAIDAAQTGFDVTLRLRPKQLAFANGTLDLGGYGYRSDSVDFFGGGRVRLGFQILRGAIISAEVNHDERFNTTGLLSVGWTFGANGGVGGEYAGLGRDLETTQRNDHIVRVASEASFVVNPLTGLPYNVVHVNNLGGAEGSGEGTFENPFLTLAEAELASANNDAIFVASGDGTDRNLDTGITLQQGQLLLGDGGTFAVPDASTGGVFQLTTNGGTGPVISNPLGSTVVDLADGNRIAGVTIDGLGTNNAINGDGVTDLVLEDVIVQNAGQNGVRLANFSGDLDIRDSTFTSNGASGLLVENLTDSTANILLDNNIASLNGQDGFRFQDFDPGTFILNANTTSNNLGNGLFLNNFANTATNGLNILNHTADANVASGIVVDTGNGKLNILSPTITNNAVNGIRITDFTNIPGDNTIIAGVGGTTGVLDNNGLGESNLLIELTQPGLLQNVLVTETTISNGNGTGIDVFATGANTELNIDIFDGVSITGNFGDGIALVSTESATINANIGNPDLTTVPLQITNNAFLGGAGISILASGFGGDLATVNANITNVAIQNDQGQIEISDDSLLFAGTTGVDIVSVGTAIVDVVVSDSNIGAPAETFDLDVTNGVQIFLANDNSFGRAPNRIVLDDLNIVVGGSSTDGLNLGNAGIGVNIQTFQDTLSDIVISDSIITPNGTAALLPPDPDGTAFGDQIGDSGIRVQATGAAVVVDPTPPTLGLDADGDPLLGVGLAGPGTVAAANPVVPDIISDGIDDNLTQLTLLNNTVRDFTFDGVDISTFGDAHLLLNISGNTVVNNGAGLNNDVDNDNVFNEDAVPAPPAATDLTFFDGINIDAFDASTISARINGNLFQDNLERGLSLNTFGDATINAIVSGNGFAGNDRGEDTDAVIPQTGMGLLTSGFFDLEAINNEEFFFRPHETTVFVLDANEFNGNGGNELFDPLFVDPDTMEIVGMILGPMDGPVGIPVNTGMDIFGNPIPIGEATLNLNLLNNGFQLGTEILDFALPPGGLFQEAFGEVDVNALIVPIETKFFNRFNP